MGINPDAESRAPYDAIALGSEVPNVAEALPPKVRSLLLAQPISDLKRFVPRTKKELELAK